MWNEDIEYQVGDIVEFSVSFYQRINFDVSGEGNDDPQTDTDNWQEISITPNFTNFFATVDAGVASVKIVSMTGVSSADIGGFRISDPRGEPPIFLELDFSQLDSAALHLRDTTHTNTFAPGAFHTVTEVPFGKASKDTTATLTPPEIPEIPANPPTLPVAIPARPNAQYLESSADVGQYNIIKASWGVGGQEVALIPNSGAAFSGRTCGDDDDADGLCNDEETADAQIIDAGFGNTMVLPIDPGLLFPLNGDTEGNVYPDAGTTGAGAQASPGVLHKDVFLEIDVMCAI